MVGNGGALEIKHRDDLTAGGWRCRSSRPKLCPSSPPRGAGGGAASGSVLGVRTRGCGAARGPGGGAARGGRLQGGAGGQAARGQPRGPGGGGGGGGGDFQHRAPQHGAGGAEAGAAHRRPRAAAPQRCRGLLEAAPRHVLVLRQGGAGPADPRRDPPRHRRHESGGQELPERPAGAAHRQGSPEEQSGGHGGADVVLHRGDHRQGRPDRVQRLKTNTVFRAKFVMGSVTIKPGTDVELLWSFVAAAAPACP